MGSRYWTGSASGRAGSSWRGTLSFQGGDSTCQQHLLLPRHPTALDSHPSKASCSHQAGIGFHSSPAGAPAKGSLSPEMMMGGEQRGCSCDTAVMATGDLLCQQDTWVLKMQLSTYKRKRTQRKHGLKTHLALLPLCQAPRELLLQEGGQGPLICHEAASIQLGALHLSEEELQNLLSPHRETCPAPTGDFLIHPSILSSMDSWQCPGLRMDG